MEENPLLKLRSFAKSVWLCYISRTHVTGNPGRLVNTRVALLAPYAGTGGA